MPNWSGWKDNVDVIFKTGDDLDPKDREVLENIMVPLGVALAQTAPRSQLYHDLARCQTEKHCTPLKYDKNDDKFHFFRDGKERTLDPDLFVERGFKVCKRKDTGDVYVKFGKPLKGMLAVSYEGVTCDGDDEEIGSVHLHPAGAVFPSGQDMLAFVLDKYNCIAGKVYDPKDKKEYARVFCAVTDDVYYDPLTNEERKHLDGERIAAEYSDLIQMRMRYDRDVTERLSRISGYFLRVESDDGVYVYAFPPRNRAALEDLLELVRDHYKDAYKLELYSIDLSKSKPPSLSTLKK